LKKYRRIEVNAYRRRVTVVSGEWRPGDVFDTHPAPTADEVSLNYSDDCEPVEPDSPEGQAILVEAVRTLERRLSPEAHATIRAGENSLTPTGSNRNGFLFKLQSFYQSICPRALRFARKEK
jgi:hypothetical protein